MYVRRQRVQARASPPRRIDAMCMSSGQGSSQASVLPGPRHLSIWRISAPRACSVARPELDRLPRVRQHVVVVQGEKKPGSVGGDRALARSSLRMGRLQPCDDRTRRLGAVGQGERPYRLEARVLSSLWLPPDRSLARHAGGARLRGASQRCRSKARACRAPGRTQLPNARSASGRGLGWSR